MEKQASGRSWIFRLLLIGLLGSVLTQTRLTESGAQCSFPQAYEGTIYTDCYEVGGNQVCLVGQELQKCASTSTSTSSSSSSTPTPTPESNSEPVLTVTGQQCQFPFKYGPYDYEKCVFAAGGQKCMVSSGEMQDCVFPDAQNNTTAAENRETADGRICEIPFVYAGDTYNNCAQILGNEYCILNNKWVSCAPVEVSPTVKLTIIPDAAPTLEPIQEASPPSVTLTIVPDVVPTPELIQEQPSPQDTILLVVPSAQTPSPEPVQEESPQDTIFLTVNPSPSPAPSDVAPLNLPPTPTVELQTRTTVDGRECVLPFIYKARLFSDCAEDSGKEICRVDNTYVECAPLEGSTPVPSLAPELIPVPTFTAPVPSPRVPPPASPIIPRFTVTGQQCDFPFVYGPYNYTNCIYLNNTFTCMAGGDMLECAPLEEESTPTPSLDTPVLVPFAPLIENKMLSPQPQTLFPQAQSPNNQSRLTVDGQSCDLPFTFNGQLYYDCVNFGGKEQCLIDDQWLECESLSPTTATTPTLTLSKRVTIQGENCTFPFMYKGIIYTDCFILNNAEYCSTDNNPISDDSLLQQCEPETQFKPPAVKNIRYTFDGQICTFPNYYLGKVYNDCFEVQDQLMCEVDGVLNPCGLNYSTPVRQESSTQSPESGFPVRFTTDGQQCSFPNFYQGQVYYDCFMVQDTMSCEVNGIVFPCMDTSPQAESSPSPILQDQEVVLESIAPISAERESSSESLTLPPPEVGKDESLSAAAIGGIVFAVLFVTIVAIAVVLVVLYFYRKRILKGKYREMEKKVGQEGDVASAGEGHPTNGSKNGGTGPISRPNHMQFIQSSVELSKV